MSVTAAFLDWGAAVSFGYLTSTTVAAIQLPYILVAFSVLVGVTSLWSRPRRFVVYLISLGAAALLARFVVVELIRLFIQTTRPYEYLSFLPLIDPVNEFSFPSGHVSVLSALAFIAWGTRPAAGAALLFGAVIVGLARVLAGVHWPIDVAGGVFVGAFTALIVYYASDKLRHYL
jgi:membrane-associated phospholipid phosphatase